MNKANLTKIASSVLFATVLLTGCTGKEEREAKYLQNAQEYFDQENIDKAKIEIKNVLQINPNNAQARYLLAEMDEKEQNWKGMFSNLSVAVESDPKFIPALYKLGLLYLASGEADQVEKQAKAIEAANPAAAEYFALRAILAQKNDKPEEATDMAKKALQIDPANIAAVGVLIAQSSGQDSQGALNIVTEALKKNKDEQMLNLMKIRLLEQQGKTEEIIAVFNQMIAAKPKELGTMFQLTQYLISKKRVDEAESVLLRAIEADPENVQPKLWLVSFIQQYKTPADAKAMLEKFYQDNANNGDIRDALASRYLADKEVAKAKSLYTKVIDADPKSSAAIDARNKLILIAGQEQDRPAIDALLKDILELEPENADALSVRASLRRSAGDLDGAIADLRVARKSKPDSLPVVLGLASAQEAAGVRELALENYRAALSLQANNLPASIGVGRLLYASGDSEKALATLVPINKANPENVEVINILLSIYNGQKKWDAAMELLNPLLLKNETAPLGFLFKARLLAAQNDLKGAQEALEQSLAKRTSPEALRDLVTLLVSQQKADKAVTLLNETMTKEPKATFAQELLGGVYLATEKYNDAEKIFAKLIAQNPQETGFYRKQLQTYVALKKSEKEVLALLDNGISKVKNSDELLVLKAEYYQAVNKPLDALAIYEVLLEKNPKSQLLQNNIVALILDYAPTKENLEKAQKLSADLVSSQNPALLDTVGWLQYKLGNYPQALSLLQDARTKGSKGGVYDYHLGMAYYQAGNKDKAQELLRAAIADANEKYVGKEEAAKVLQELSAK